MFGENLLWRYLLNSIVVAMYRTLLIILSVFIILVPFSGLPGSVEDFLMQMGAAVVLILILLLPKPERKKEEPEVSEEPYGI